MRGGGGCLKTNQCVVHIIHSNDILLIQCNCAFQSKNTTMYTVMYMIVYDDITIINPFTLSLTHPHPHTHTHHIITHTLTHIHTLTVLRFFEIISSMIPMTFELISLQWLLRSERTVSSWSSRTRCFVERRLRKCSFMSGIKRIMA